MSDLVPSVYRAALRDAGDVVAALDRALQRASVNETIVLRLARRAHGLLEGILAEEAEYLADVERRGAPRVGFSIDCAKCYGTGPLHTCLLLRVDAVWDAIGAADGVDMSSVNEFADFIRAALVAAWRRTSRGADTWENFGDAGFRDEVRHVAGELAAARAARGGSVVDVVTWWAAEEIWREKKAQAPGRLSCWVHHHLVGASLGPYMICALFDPSTELGGHAARRLEAARGHVAEAKTALEALPHGREALEARRAYAGRRLPFRISAAASAAAIMAIGWDGGHVVALGEGPWREIHVAEAALAS